MSGLRIPASAVGVTAGPREHDIDARWLMAYAAALGETASGYFDTTRPEGLLAHPLFPVCYEWPLALDVRAKVLPDDVAVRGVHATHRLTLHRPPRAGDRLSTTATVASLEPRTPGAYLVLRMETVDTAGRPVSTTEYGSLYLGVQCENGPHLDPLPGGEREREGRSRAEPWWSVDIPIASTLAHVYTECARIWNPIHTDRAMARGAGLPDIILHGTATWALAGREVLRLYAGADPRRLRRLHGRFRAMVLPGTEIRLEHARSGDGVVRFVVRNHRGEPAIDQGFAVLA